MSPSKVQQHLDPERVRQGATLKTFREMRGLKVSELANAVPMSSPYLSNIEAGRKPLTPPLVARFSELLGVRPIALVRPDTFDAAA
jgi:transcriptional regulator with XRE-family HTH domain